MFWFGDIKLMLPTVLHRAWKLHPVSTPETLDAFVRLSLNFSPLRASSGTSISTELARNDIVNPWSIEMAPSVHP